MNYPINDPYFRVKVLSKTERPNLLSYLAMHQCYSENVIVDEFPKISSVSDEELGRRVVDNCLKFGHYSVIEHPHITFCVSGFPHNVMVQATRHRLLSFSVQSQRYTSKRVINIVSTSLSYPKRNRHKLVEKIFYFRSIGNYTDRSGSQYNYTEEYRNNDIDDTYVAIKHYYDRVIHGKCTSEHARDFLPQNIRQDFVVTFNARSLLHFCDLRLPKDAQLEIRTMAEMLFEHFKEWMPECAEWYEKNRKGKSKLAP